MGIADVFCWIVIGGAIALVFGFFFWALCVIAGQSDDISEKYWNEYWGKEEEMQEKAQNAYERYRERFANDYGLTIEEATNFQAVKNYKEYLEKEYEKYGVQICEKVGDA